MPDSPIILAAGGTGGHIFPAEALAETLLARGEEVVLVTDRRYDNYQGTLGSLPTHRIRSASPGRGVIRKIKALLNIIGGVIEAWKLLRRLDPAVVVGFGGYPSFPTMLAAHILNIPTVVHEQNAVLGRVNKVVAGEVDAIATSFPEVQRIGKKNQSKVVLTGNPVRSQVKAVREVPYAAPATNGEFRILVTGGSQGASIFSETIPNAVKRLPTELQQRLVITQQCRKEDHDKAAALYQNLPVKVELAPFFADVPERLKTTHLLICRSGASTVAEVTVAGRPALFVPYKHAMDDHQTANAKLLVDAGAGWRIAQDDFTPETLAHWLAQYMEHPSMLEDAAKKARQLGHPEAAEKLAEVVMGLLS